MRSIDHWGLATIAFCFSAFCFSASVVVHPMLFLVFPVGCPELVVGCDRDSFSRAHMQEGLLRRVCQERNNIKCQKFESSY